MKRIWAILLALVLISSLTLPALAANDTTASTMRLTETEGTVATKNASGKALTVRDGMRLYNGYKVSTEQKSYAYINLDNSKAVKLDASSAVDVSQSGKKLELKLTAGELFFNVPVALKNDESLNIRTSSMVAGVRGTSGWVHVLDRYTTRIGLLEGSLTIYSLDPITGAERSVTITGGQIATIIRHERASAMEQALIDQGVIIEPNIVEELTELGQVVEELREGAVPGFAGTEVAKDQELQDRINAESPLDADEIVQNAEDQLAEDEADDRENTPAPESSSPTVPSELFAQGEVTVVTQTVYVEVPGETKIEYVEVPVEVPTGDPMDMDDPTAAEINTAFETMNVVSVTNLGASQAVDLKDVPIAAGKALYVVNGTLTNTGANIPMDGTLILLPDATLNNTGSLSVNSSNSLHVFGKLNNSGTLAIPGKVSVEIGGLMKNTGTVTLGGSLVLNGEYEDTVNEVMILNEENQSVTFLGSFRDALAAEEQPTIKLLDKGTLDPNGPITASANLDLNGNSAEVVGGLLEISANDFTVINSKEFGELTGYAVVKSGGLFNLYGGALVVPAGKIGVTCEEGSESSEAGYFNMYGSIIDARNGRYALAMSEYSDSTYSLESGYLLGTPTSSCAYYSDDIGEIGPEIPLWREDSDSHTPSYFQGYRVGHNDHHRSAYAAGYGDGLTDGYAGAAEGTSRDADYDDGTDKSYSDDLYQYRYNRDYNLGYKHGTYDGKKDGYRSGYQFGLDDGTDLRNTSFEDADDLMALFRDLLKEAHTSGFEYGFGAEMNPSSSFPEYVADVYINSVSFEHLCALIDFDPDDIDFENFVGLYGTSSGEYYNGKLLDADDEIWNDENIWENLEWVDFINLNDYYSFGGGA